MTLTRQHFEMIARVLRETPYSTMVDADAAGLEREALAYAFADAFEATNPRFDRARFVRACSRAEQLATLRAVGAEVAA